MSTQPSIETGQFDSRPGIRPRLTFGRRLDAASRAALPMAIALLLLLVLHAPIRLPGQAQLLSGAELACVYYWSLYLPRVMPSASVFGLGLCVDLLGAGPLGLSVLLLLVAHVGGLAWRHSLVRQGGLPVWAVFVATATVCCVSQWLLTMILEWRLLPPGPMLVQLGLAAGEYLVLAAPLGWCMRRIVAPLEG